MVLSRQCIAVISTFANCKLDKNLKCKLQMANSTKFIFCKHLGAVLGLFNCGVSSLGEMKLLGRGEMGARLIFSGKKVMHTLGPLVAVKLG